MGFYKFNCLFIYLFIYDVYVVITMLTSTFGYEQSAKFI